MSWFARPNDNDFGAFKDSSETIRELWKYEFSLKTGERKNIVFLADERITVYKHTIKIGQKFLSFVCSNDENCYGCGSGVYKQMVQYSSVLDLTPFEGKDGKKRNYSKRLYPVVGDAIEALNRRRLDKGGDLTGFKVEVFRDGDRSPKCGNDWTIREKVDFSKIPAEDAKPMDMLKILAPPPASAIKARVKFGGSDLSSTQRRSDLMAAGVTDEADNDIPF